MVDTITALADTWLKKDYRYSADDLSDDRKLYVESGKNYKVLSYEERDAGTEMGGHFKIDLDHGGGIWFIFGEHWKLPWQVEIEQPVGKLPEWDEVDWSDWSSPVSKYFTVGEVTLRDRERIPTQSNIKQNVIKIARKMDDIREWWDAPLGINSWYRPWHVNARIGSRAPNHPGGYAVDFRPLKGGSVWDLQQRFEKEWYNAGKWNGGFGRGAQKGFIHLDLRGKRIWNY
ncbi:MAG: D-Ala-D-Ala carboxypeptidase family metallohydrolase [Leptolyngbyaceae bacterium]|nr:D-Ala-D-Ala carboxypeptidase family metallohydrolase [Leptolyngbyaceae bacterium]